VARFLILDSEALSALVHASRRSAETRRAQAVLASAHRLGALVRVPAAVLVEVYRGRKEDAGVDFVLKRVGRVVPAGQSIAKVAGGLLSRHRLDSAHAVDALVVATAIRLGGGLIATHDPEDMTRLAQGFPNVKVFAL
jgi:predicted nucleic acid-binding protein